MDIIDYLGECFGPEWIEANKRAFDGFGEKVFCPMPTQPEQRREILHLVDVSLYGGGLYGKPILDDESVCLAIYKKDGVPTVAVCKRNKENE